MEDDWDLYAVVRSCSAAASATTGKNSPSCKNPVQQDFTIPCLEKDYPFETLTSSSSTSSNSFHDLNDLYRPFFSKSQTPPPQTVPTCLPPISPLSVLQGLQEFLPSEKPPPVMVRKPFLHLQTELLPKHSKPNSNPRSKRRKNHLKKVCHVAAEDLSSDQWSWRKYGQKPIKGSPYPRGYYRCSTSKGCLARKQVERNRSDPGMFILTYTGEHNHSIPTHRNSLAGSTRHKPVSDESGKTPPERVDSISKEEDLPEVEEEDDGLSLSDEPNMALDDDFFAGLEDFGGAGAGDCAADHFPADVLFSWSLDSGAAAAACGGG